MAIERKKNADRDEDMKMETKKEKEHMAKGVFWMLGSWCLEVVSELNWRSRRRHRKRRRRKKKNVWRRVWFWSETEQLRWRSKRRTMAIERRNANGDEERERTRGEGCVLDAWEPVLGASVLAKLAIKTKT